jgi:hypothetical protein
MARWRGHTHEELYKLLHDGPGAAASADPSRRWAELATTLTEVGEDLRKALDLTGAGWSGRAAGAAYDRLSRTAKWAEVTGTNAAEMRTAVEDQADHIAKARADMPVPEGVTPVQPDPTVAPAVQVVGAQTDLEAREAARAAGEERAFEVMATYQENTEATITALATFEKPAPLFESSKVHHNGSSAPTHSSSAQQNWHPPQQQHHEERRHWWQPERPGHSSSTSGAGAVHTEAPAPRPAAPPPAPGHFSGATTDPLAPARPGQRRAQTRGNAAPKGVGPTSGIGTPVGDLQAQAQAAAASQAASTHGAGAPVTGAGGVGAGTQDKLAMRRFGMEAIGSSQWFGDDEPVMGQSPRRRYDVREDADITEAVSVMGEEHKLPPTVIGD